ncbi:hypothetical protein Scep_018740 [Stephania cephalantha]|uniref:Uncharacterized protein n=1 Tax=Stephania cephalantha TaxID=152367 RepID=A0AAP0NP51_9MAGN
MIRDEKLTKLDRSRTIEKRCDLTEARDSENVTTMKHCKTVLVDNTPPLLEHESPSDRAHVACGQLGQVDLGSEGPTQPMNLAKEDLNRWNDEFVEELLEFAVRYNAKIDKDQSPLLRAQMNNTRMKIMQARRFQTILSGDLDLNFLKAIELAARPYDREPEKEMTNAIIDTNSHNMVELHAVVQVYVRPP